MYKHLYILLVSVIFFSCEFDNYDPPSLVFEGNLIYNNEPFLYDGSANRPVLRLYQEGFGLQDYGTVVRVNEKGYFSQLFFSGDYKLTLNNAQYPFEFKDFNSLGVGLGYDSIAVNLKGSIQRDFEVVPYYVISEVNATVSGNDIAANFNVSAVDDNSLKNIHPNVRRVWLFLSTTPIVNSSTRANSVLDVTPFSTGSQQLTITMNSDLYRTAYLNNFKDYGWYRVAIELEGVPNYYLFSEIKKIEGIPL